MVNAQKNNDALVAMLKDPAQRNRAFSIFMKQYGRKLYWHIRRIVVDHDDAEDAMQETAICIFNNIGSFYGNSALGTWVYRIATNEALRLLDRNKTANLSIDAADGENFFNLHADEYVDYDDAVTVKLQQAVLSLPTKQQLAFNMRYYDGLEYDEIARILDSSESSVKANYSIAKQKIIKYMNLDNRD